MTLPPLPPTTTSRYRLNYTANGLAHSIVVHNPTGTSQATALSNATALANLLKPLVFTDTVFQSVDWADLGSDVFNPLGTLNIAGTFTGNGQPVGRPWYYGFVGRSPSGRKTRFFLFGVPIPNDANFRITTSELASIATAVTALNSGTGGIMCIDASQPVWKPYINVGTHDHYVKRIRRTG